MIAMMSLGMNTNTETGLKAAIHLTYTTIYIYQFESSLLTINI